MSEYDPTEYRRYFESECTYLAGFWRNTHRFPDNPAVLDPETGTNLSYAELGEQVRLLATGLAEAGVRPGDVVVYQLYNSSAFALLYLATQACGAIGSPVNFRLAPGETAFVLEQSRPAAFLFDAELAGQARAALDRSTHRPGLVATVGEPVAPGSTAFGALFAARPGTLPGTASVYTETTRLYTSGTTGMPKGVPLPSLVELFSAHDVIMHFPLGPGDRTLNMTPWFHRGGLYAGGPNPAFYTGASVLPMRAFDPGRCLDLVASAGLTFLIGAPTNLAMLAAAQTERPRDLSTLRGVVTMGAPLEREACLHYQEVLSARVFNGYGTTEAFWNTFLRPEDLPEHAGSAGRACTDDEVAVVRVHPDRFAAPGEHVAKDGQEVGEVIVRSPKCGFAYAGDPGQQAEKFHDGWLYIGDLATWDEHEYLTIVGRKDDMIVSGGENVHPVQVEEALNEHPGITDSLVIAVPDPKWGNRVVAYIERARADCTAAECDRHCRAHPMLADYKRPRAYRFVDSLPRTATGKKIHYRAREQAEIEYTQGLFETVD
ncbi:class I adenylate-forming enzyme family protein [Sciscionella sediminilitoris]|uniref:class I adenylate-forming enzyme family protein n=1 Tax=Sciscionella sediminilitoris TaxID=1445613 RepID=UPI0004DF91A0|nr:AMP-binding protein [Sciscionella sp. SE31]